MNESSHLNRILVVEDDDANREFLRALLESESFCVVTARDGAEALEWLRGHSPPDLVLLDLEMPRMNGWEFLQAAERAALLRGTVRRGAHRPGSGASRAGLDLETSGS